MWDSARWRQVDVAGPSARALFGMAAFNGTALIFGGSLVPGGLSTANDTWRWDRRVWAPFSVGAAPSRRSDAAIASR
jgi:hypothetical protein